MGPTVVKYECVGIGVLAHNLTQAQKLLFLDPDCRSRTIRTLRWQLIAVAGRLVLPGRRGAGH